MNMRWRTQARCHHTTPPTIDDLPLQARSGLARLDPVLALRAVHDGAILIDTRPESSGGHTARYPAPSSSNATTWNGAATRPARLASPKRPATT
jgi:hypothetical protein